MGQKTDLCQYNRHYALTHRHLGHSQTYIRHFASLFALFAHLLQPALLFNVKQIPAQLASIHW